MKHLSVRDVSIVMLFERYCPKIYPGKFPVGVLEMNFYWGNDLASSSAAVLGRELVAGTQLGLRPEHLSIADSANSVVDGTLELVENLGEYALVHLLTDTNVEFIAKTEKPPAVPKGSTISFGVDAENAHFFDANSGARLG